MDERQAQDSSQGSEHDAPTSPAGDAALVPGARSAELPRASAHAAHRAALLERLEDGEGVLIFAAPHHYRNGDAEYGYRQSSDLLYLTGWPDPEAALLVRKGAEQPVVMFVQPRDPERETWTGRRYGPEGAVEVFGADAAHDWSELASQLPALLLGLHTLHYRFAEEPENDRLVAGAVQRARRLARRNHLDVPDAFIDPGRLLHELRLVKTEEELAVMQRAAEITGEAHRAAMAATAPGRMEYELESVYLHTFRRRGGAGPGYTCIVGGGVNATILHYVRNDCALQDGDLVCVDAGCELDGYTADVTRTWPVNGRFTEAQRELYSLVLEAELASIAACTTDHSFADVHEVSKTVLTRGLVRLGFLEGDPNDADHVQGLVADEAYKPWFMHGTSHWLGLDVHDVGSYNREGQSRPLRPGMVLTVEPGLYVAADDERAPARFRGMGIRIEDDVCVTEGAPRVLTADIPKSIEDVEAAVRGGVA
jgi:Xaa-Pro aminopeptidase